MNKKGYLLSELIISFALSFIILIIIFNTTISLNQKLSDLFVENTASSQQFIFNRKIGNDFTTKTVAKMELTDKICTITFTDNTSRELIVATDYITYNNERIDIPDKMKIGDTFTCKIESGIAKLIVPIKYSRQAKNYGIELYNLSSSFTY